METLYLLSIINELGKDYQIKEDLLNKHFGVFDENDRNYKLNYFIIISLLNYIKNKEGFNEIRKVLQDIINKKFDNFASEEAESVFLLIDVLTCPYIASSDEEVKKFRRKILNKIKFFDDNTSGIDEDNLIDNISDFTSDWFFSWKENDLGKELNTKRGHSVY